MATTTTPLLSQHSSTSCKRCCTSEVCLPVWIVVSTVATLIFFGTTLWAISQANAAATITYIVGILGLLASLCNCVYAIAYRFFRPLYS
jgi:hypothetical protein